MISDERYRLAICLPSTLDIPKSLAVSKLENMCFDLSSLIIDEGKNLQSLSKELSEIEVEPFNIEEFVSFTPSLQEGGVVSPKLLHLEPDEDIGDFLEDL